MLANQVKAKRTAPKERRRGKRAQGPISPDSTDLEPVRAEAGQTEPVQPRGGGLDVLIYDPVENARYEPRCSLRALAGAPPVIPVIL